MINTVTLQIDSIMSLNWGSEVSLPVASVTRGSSVKSLGYRLHCNGRDSDETLMNNHRFSWAKESSARVPHRNVTWQWRPGSILQAGSGSELSFFHLSSIIRGSCEGSGLICKSAVNWSQWVYICSFLRVYLECIEILYKVVYSIYVKVFVKRVL